MPRTDTICEPAAGTATRLLAAYLERECRGREAARPEHVIRSHLAAAGLRLSAREFQQVVSDAVRGRACPIGSSDAGYFWCVEPADFEAARAYLVTRFDPMAERIAGLEAMRDRAARPRDVLFDPWGNEPTEETP